MRVEGRVWGPPGRPPVVIYYRSETTEQWGDAWLHVSAQVTLTAKLRAELMWGGWGRSAIGGAAIGMTLERAGGVENLFNALDKDGLPREGLAYASLVGERVATGFVSLVKSFRLMRDQMIQVRPQQPVLDSC
jgi:hypothetical protein